MFTGIVQEVGTVSRIDRSGELLFRIETEKCADGLRTGASVACNGICLTATNCEPAPGGWIEVQVSGETLDLTNASEWAEGSKINLERSLRVGDELGGHIVTGHVDGVAQILSLDDDGESRKARLRVPAEFAAFVARKGSIALEGVSLTVNEVSGTDFEVNLIPHTLNVTTWGGLQTGSDVNFEVDILARYIRRMAAAA